MGWRGTLLLAALVLLVAGVFLMSPQPPPEIPDDTLLGEPRFVHDTTPSPRLLNFIAADVSKMTLGYGDEVVSVTRTAGHWKGAADARRLDDFLNDLEHATLIATMEREAPAADFGLDAPARRVLLESDNDQQVLLFMGDRNPAGTSVYVRVGDGPVSIAGALIVWEFDKAFAAITGRKSPL